MARAIRPKHGGHVFAIQSTRTAAHSSRLLVRPKLALARPGFDSPTQRDGSRTD